MWLPVVNPAHSHAVAWRGHLDLAGGLAVPRGGNLVMIDWAQIDPYAAANAPAPAGTPSGSPAASPAATPAPTDSPTLSPAASASASASTAPASPTAAPADTPKVRPTDGPATPDSTDQPSRLPDGWTNLPVTGESADSPIVDWQARWSLDGQVLGVWIAEAAGETWGRLTVFAIDAATNQVAAGDPLVAPTLARRGFSLGLDRVAWVAPSEDNPDGGLRVRTWGNDGVGGLRLLPDKLDEVVPAF
jgi:hypothetical protein